MQPSSLHSHPIPHSIPLLTTTRKAEKQGASAIGEGKQPLISALGTEVLVNQRLDPR
jgi:hypothetical protein